MDSKAQAKQLTKLSLYLFGAFVSVFIILALSGTITYEKAGTFILVGLVSLIVIWALFVPLIAGSTRQELDVQNLMLANYGKWQARYISWWLGPLTLAVLYYVSGLETTLIVAVAGLLCWLIAKMIQKHIN